MANALPIALLAGGALLLATGKKKRHRKKAAATYEVQRVPPTKPPAAATNTSGPSGKAASSAVWKSRQTALAFVAGMKVCNSHPGTVDGVYGPATLNAIIAFQICAGTDVDGKWGPATDAAMKKMLVDIARGQVKISKPPSKSPTSKKAPAPKYSYLNPIDWPQKKWVTPEGHVRDKSWLPRNLAVVFARPGTKAWFSPWDPFGYQSKNSVGYSHPDPGLYKKFVSIHAPAGEGSTTRARNDPDMIRHYFKIVSSLKNLATMYPDIHFRVDYYLDDPTRPIHTSPKFPVVIDLSKKWFETGFRSTSLSRVSKDKIEWPTPTPNLVHLVANRIEQNF